MKKKVTLEGFQCDACGDIFPSDYVPHTVKIKMSGPAGCIKKDKMHLCKACSQSMADMIIQWYSRKYSVREENKKRYRAILATEGVKE